MHIINQMERWVARRVVRELKAMDEAYVFSVNDGEETVLRGAKSERKVLAAMFSTDEDWLVVSNKYTGKRVGWVRFIYGNSGWDVVNDYTTNLEPAMELVTNYCDTLEAKYDRKPGIPMRTMRDFDRL